MKDRTERDAKPDWTHFGRDLGDQSVVFHEDDGGDPPTWRGVTKAELLERLNTSRQKLFEAFRAGIQFGITPDRYGPNAAEASFEKWLKEYES